MERARYIVVEGPIGVGKTALASLLAEQLGGRAVLEAAEENPFLPRFYQDRRTHAFQTQVFFLLSRFQQQQALVQQDLFNQVTISDHLFAKDQIYAALTLEPDERALYQRIYEALEPRVVKPDLVVFLQSRAEVLLSRIRRRGRDFERHLESAYLEALCRTYGDFFFHYEETPLLVVNASDVDLVSSKEDLEDLVAVVRRHQKGTMHYVPMATKSLADERAPD